MEIDLREIQALHARYAREPVVIDLESLVRARPAPLLLAHDPNVRSSAASPLRRVWNARANVGRGALMVVGGTVLSAAIGMGAAALWAKVHEHHAAAVAPQGARDAAPRQVSQSAAVDVATGDEPASVVRTLTSPDLGARSGRAASLASIDPSALLRSAPAAAGAEQANGNRTASLTDEQNAIASPLRQHILERATQNAPAVIAPTHVPPAAPHEAQVVPPSAKPVEQVVQETAVAPAATAPASAVHTQQASTHHAVRHHAPTSQPSAPAVDAKNPPAVSSSPQHGDVQLF